MKMRMASLNYDAQLYKNCTAERKAFSTLVCEKYG
jgi:hypothetical protein